jgi:hypothetical protein
MTLNNGGTIFPGTGPTPTIGTVLSGTSLTWNGGGTISLQLGVAPNDEIKLTGALTKGSAGTFTIDIFDGGIPSTATDFTLMTFASTSFLPTSFKLELPASITGGTLVETATSLELEGVQEAPAQDEQPEGGTLVVRQETIPAPGTASIVLPSGDQPILAMSDSLSSSSVVTQAVELTPTPEPGSTLLLAFGSAALVGWRRRRKVSAR